MMNNTTNITEIYDVIIVGGSYAGLSAAMALGRSLRKTLIIDSGLPCNRKAPHSHNFITNDGKKPHIITRQAVAQVLEYSSVRLHKDIVTAAKNNELGFEVSTASNHTFVTKKLIFATGLKDIMPKIKGFSECWGISVIHCPYCHGYEVRHQKTGILANGENAFHYARLVSNWAKDITILTNGKSTLSEEQTEKINRHGIAIVEDEIAFLKHDAGELNGVVLATGTTISLSAIYARPAFAQHCNLPEALGCEFTEQGLLKTDMFQRTTLEGVYACGDNANPFRSVSGAVAAGTIAGASVNNKLVEEEF